MSLFAQSLHRATEVGPLEVRESGPLFDRDQQVGGIDVRKVLTMMC